MIERINPRIERIKTRIEQIHRFGRTYHVRLACGHAFECSPEQLDERQLFIGKPYRCGECGETA